MRPSERAVPRELCLDESPPARLVVRLAAAVCGHRLRQEGFVGRARGRRVRDALAFPHGHRGPALASDACHQRAIDVQRLHRNAVQASELEERQIQRRGEAPHARPVGLPEERALVELAGDPPVEDRLGAAREHLEAEHHGRVLGGERGNGLELPAMVVGPIVVLAEQDDVRARGARDDRGRRLLGAGGGEHPACGWDASSGAAGRAHCLRRAATRRGEERNHRERGADRRHARQDDRTRRWIPGPLAAQGVAPPWPFTSNC
jgi:hypothetical protein